MTWLDKIIGPRIPDSVLHRERRRFRRPTLLLGTAALLLLISIFFPYWRIRLFAPQYPGGLVAKVYVNRVEGDVREIDGLNHYIGMRPLEEAAQLERSLSIILIVAMALLVAGAIYVHSPWAAVLSLPALLYPLIFLADLYYWLWNFGTHLDPRAPLSSSVKPFVPPLLGEARGPVSRSGHLGHRTLAGHPGLYPDHCRPLLPPQGIQAVLRSLCPRGAGIASRRCCCSW
ncbi:cytochrome C [Rhodothermus marinus]|uniref:cytochrome C n=1 Tax=Rhodothermus marinus TaxID=29549 RepID=UPI000B1E1E13|nr:cytochrome C [Rhodothermus marinus]